MRKLTIEIAEPGDDRFGFDVVDEQGRRCDGLCWDEMLGQVAMLTMPPARLGNGYPMRTPDEWATHREAQRQRLRAEQREDAEAQAALGGAAA